MTLEVAAPAHGRVQVAGLARFFPARSVHAQRSTGVVAGNNCELQSTDHYHVHRVSVSLEASLRPGSPGNAALHALLKDQSADGIARFQDSMRQIAGPSQEKNTRASVPVRVDHRLSVTGAAGVQAGDESHMTVSARYVVEHSELPIADLLVLDAIHGERGSGGRVVDGERGVSRDSGCGWLVLDDTLSVSDSGRPSP